MLVVVALLAYVTLSVAAFESVSERSVPSVRALHTLHEAHDNSSPHSRYLRLEVTGEATVPANSLEERHLVVEKTNSFLKTLPSYVKKVFLNIQKFFSYLKSKLSLFLKRAQMVFHRSGKTKPAEKEENLVSSIETQSTTVEESLKASETIRKNKVGKIPKPNVAPPAEMENLMEPVGVSPTKQETIKDTPSTMDTSNQETLQHFWKNLPTDDKASVKIPTFISTYLSRTGLNAMTVDDCFASSLFHRLLEYPARTDEAVKRLWYETIYAELVSKFSPAKVAWQINNRANIPQKEVYSNLMYAQFEAWASASIFWAALEPWKGSRFWATKHFVIPKVEPDVLQEFVKWSKKRIHEETWMLFIDK